MKVLVIGHLTGKDILQHARVDRRLIGGDLGGPDLGHADRLAPMRPARGDDQWPDGGPGMRPR
jgi:hypothetical protein